MKRILAPAKHNFKLFLNLNIEMNTAIYSFLRKNEALPFYIRQPSIFNLHKISQHVNISRLLYVCIKTGKARNIVTNYKLSNLSFKLMLKKFFFCGFVT